MAIRKIIKIDRNKCNGCGLCANACHEGAITIEEGKAKLISDQYCDGLGDCLPACPTQAITFEKREADEYNEALVKQHLDDKNKMQSLINTSCLGSKVKTIKQTIDIQGKCENFVSELSQWPVQIKLMPEKAKFFDNAKLLVAADCSAFAYGDFHRKFIHNHITLIGCPKLDMIDYSEKLTAIIKNNDIKSVTVVRMEVPCCGGIENAVKTAIKNSGKFIPWQVLIISVNGEIMD